MTDPVATRIALVRHCDVENPGQVIYGHLPNFGLSAKGVRQAEALGRYFAGRRVPRIYASPLERAQQTARIIAAHLEGTEIVTTEELVEAEFGRYLQGVPVKQIPVRRPLWWLHMLLPGLLPGDETVGQMAARLDRPIHRLLADFPGEGGIAISHGDPIQAFWIRHQKRHRWALHRLQCAKGGLLELDYRGTTLDRITYVPPDRHPRPTAEGAEAETSHA